jgi:hypothetical protein
MNTSDDGRDDAVSLLVVDDAADGGLSHDVAFQLEGGVLSSNHLINHHIAITATQNTNMPALTESTTIRQSGAST